MSISREKVTYTCDCGIDYGSCGKKGVFLLENNATVDVHRVIHIHHFGEDDEIITTLGHFGDNALEALIKVISNDNLEKWDDEDFMKIKNIS